MTKKDELVLDVNCRHRTANTLFQATIFFFVLGMISNTLKYQFAFLIIGMFYMIFNIAIKKQINKSLIKIRGMK